MRGLTLQLFTSYQNNRQQCVSANDKYMSELQCIKTGVPQGSVLGPLIFLIYVNDLPIPTNSETILYANDIALICHANNFSLLQTMAKNEMVKVVKWALCNKLLINFKKTNYLLFASNALIEHRNSFEIKIFGNQLNFINVAK